MTIHLGRMLPCASCSQPATPTPEGKERTALKTRPIWPCTGRGLPSHGDRSPCWWALTPPFHPYLFNKRRSIFCGPVPEVAPGRR